MKTRPILFSGPMVRALLAGTKTQTRRAMRKQPASVLGLRIDETSRDLKTGAAWFTARIDGKAHAAIPDGPDSVTADVGCPFGGRGSRLWVKESIKCVSFCGASLPSDEATSLFCADDTPTRADAWPWKRPFLPSMFMPIGLSRITLEVTDVRVQRLQDISEEDARAEGVEPKTWGADAMAGQGARAAYAELWDEINGAGAWAANPWVWAISFKRVQP